MKKIISFIMVVMLLLAGCDYIISQDILSITNLAIESNSITSLRILQLTDLHNSEFGTHNSRLINAVRAQSPDLILLIGDLLNSNEQRTDIATNLITQLCEIAPVYCSNGNHRWNIRRNTVWMWTSCTRKRER